MELKMDDKRLFEKMEAMEEEEIFVFFQEIIDSGAVWNLQGCYSRTAESLIDTGYCRRKGATCYSENN